MGSGSGLPRVGLPGAARSAFLHKTRHSVRSGSLRSTYRVPAPPRLLRFVSAGDGNDSFAPGVRARLCHTVSIYYWHTHRTNVLAPLLRRSDRHGGRRIIFRIGRRATKYVDQPAIASVIHERIQRTRCLPPAVALALREFAWCGARVPGWAEEARRLRPYHSRRKTNMT